MQAMHFSMKGKCSSLSDLGRGSKPVGLFKYRCREERKDALTRKGKVEFKSDVPCWIVSASDSAAGLTSNLSSLPGVTAKRCE